MTDKEGSPPPPSENKQDPSQALEDGTKLVDFIEVLLRKKVLVLLIAFISTLLSISYSLWATPVYKARIAFLLPQKILVPSSIPSMLMTETNVSLYKIFLDRVQSYNHQLEIFKSNEFSKRFLGDISDSTVPEKVFLGFHSLITNIRFLTEKQKVEKVTFIEMKGPKPEVMADFLNAISKAAIKNIQSETLNYLRKKIDDRLQTISTQTTLLREANARARTRALNEVNNTILQNIDKLTKHLKNIARKLKIKDNNLRYAIPGTTQPKWYLYGQKALIEVINEPKSKKRTNNYLQYPEFFKFSNNPQSIKNIRILQLEYDKLKTIDVSQVKLEVASTIMPSIAPSTPIQPRKLLIISVGILMGLFLGILVAFISDSLENLGRRKESSSLK